MPILIRQMRVEDARIFLEVHHAAVRGTALRDYAQEVIDAWAPLPITQAQIAQVRLNPDNEYRLIAELEGRAAGIGALVTALSEFRACYVMPWAGRQRVGSAIVREIEKVAAEQGLAALELDSSLTAAPFYASLGYEVVAHTQHVLNSGEAMACLKMRKTLSPSRA